MAVRASRSITEGSDTFTIYHTFECGAFDLIAENNPGIWTEIWRDCDLGTKNWRKLWPYASGKKGVVDVEVNISGTRQRHRAYTQPGDDSFVSTLDLSGVNGGVLPPNPCVWMDLYQNGKKLPCEAFTLNYSTAIITILEEWRVPGAAYEVLFWATPSGGSSTPGT